jgi:hypothetical protein
MLLLNKCVQGVELLFPETAMLVQPFGGGLEQPSRQSAIGDTAFLHAPDQPGVLEDPEMLRNRRRRDVERFPEIAHRTFPCREPFDHRAARWIGERGKYQVERMILIHRWEMVSYADSARAGHHVSLETHGGCHHFVVLPARDAQVLQRRDDMLLERHPVGL